MIFQPMYFGIDPYLVGRLSGYVGRTVRSQAIVRIIASRCHDYQQGDVFWSRDFPWTTAHVLTKSKVDRWVQLRTMLKISSSKKKEEREETTQEPDMLSLLYLGALGTTGLTAYYGLLTIGCLKEGDKVFISGAAGATGYIAGQIAKLKYKNIYLAGSAGSDEKVQWLIKELNFDNGLNYKQFGEDRKKMQQCLQQLFPNGIDLYFDNTGGLITECVWDLLNSKARVVVCGQIARYDKITRLKKTKIQSSSSSSSATAAADGDNDSDSSSSIGKIDDFLFKLIYKEIRIQGFDVDDCKDWTPFYRDMKNWISKKQLYTKETVALGFENLPSALEGLFTGKNTGKMIVKCTDADLASDQSSLKSKL
ncbi:putative oxidoreductase [Reticulomyxa filosa]|uniref:Putative oxidoreductase n=1 Tax=Reticulomyxa filosa TaxID=46433 RepID=X6P2P7_RETFI|nr:putative oxidoreductase [Reticulomyxa filosa]|eukprot:ETO32835.1 putative oxidoreductase [Reticulomyxa filosa]